MRKWNDQITSERLSVTNNIPNNRWLSMKFGVTNTSAPSYLLKLSRNAVLLTPTDLWTLVTTFCDLRTHRLCLSRLQASGISCLQSSWWNSTLRPLSNLKLEPTVPSVTLVLVYQTIRQHTAQFSTWNAQHWYLSTKLYGITPLNSAHEMHNTGTCLPNYTASHRSILHMKCTQK